jgi:Zn-dependent peptidase ImmA (M78 family)
MRACNLGGSLRPPMRLAYRRSQCGSRDIGQDVFRGCALADDLAPFIVINVNDRAHSFTLLHELVHISGSAQAASADRCARPGKRVERFCNVDAASEFLLTRSAIGN